MANRSRVALQRLALLAVVLLMPGCGSRPATRPAPEANKTPAPAAHQLKGAMPTETDFPANWRVRTQDSRPVALPGLDDTDTAIGSVVPSGCRDFAAAFVSAPGSSIPGDFVSSTVAMVPNDAGAFDQSSVVVFATKNAADWGSPRAIKDNLRDCAQVAAEMSMRGQRLRAEFVSEPINTSQIKSEAAGSTTTIRVNDQKIRVAVVRAQTKGVLVSASSMIVSGSLDDQQALLVKLVAQTVDKLGAV
jgi:hypothetical protein